MSPPPARGKFAKTARKKAKPRLKVKRRDPIFIDGERPRFMGITEILKVNTDHTVMLLKLFDQLKKL